MKKFFALIFISLISFALVACGNNQRGGGTRLEPESPDMFTFEFMDVDQLNSDFQQRITLQHVPVKFTQGGIVITAYHGNLTQVRIPDEIVGFPVVAISASTFPLVVIEGEELTVLPVADVYLPPTVQYFSFGDIEILGQAVLNISDNWPDSITVPNGVTHLVNSHLHGVTQDMALNLIAQSAKNIELPNTLMEIPDGMFQDFSALTSITIPNGVTRIGQNAFLNAHSLLYISVPDSVEHIGLNAFHGTPWLNERSDGIIYAGRVAIGWNGDMPSDTHITLTEGTRGIGEGAFASTRLTGIVIPDSVTNIGARAFERTPLTNLVIGDGITSIGDREFERLPLTSVTIGNSVTHIGDRAFRDTQLTDLVIPDSVTHIHSRAFERTPLTNLVIGDGITSIDNRAFTRLPLTSVIIGNNVTRIGTRAFEDTQLTNIVIPDSVTHIDNRAFQRAPLTSVTIGNSVTHIGTRAFANTQLTNLVIPDSVTNIDRSAFENTPLAGIGR